MKKVYACLLGKWVCLNDDPDCAMGGNRTSPSEWLREDGSIYAPAHRDADNEHKYSSLDYVNICYRDKDYRINPIFIQIVTE